jgi:sulfite exporter TauE/SafE/copper chaperone CopZ
MNDMPTDQSSKILEVEIGGMTCANCEVLIEKKFKRIAGVSNVSVNHRTGSAEITSSSELNIDDLRHAVEEDGYSVSLSGKGSAAHRGRNTGRDYIEISAAIVIVVGIVFLLREFDAFPKGLSVSDNMSYGLVFLIGLVASVSSCIAVTGGLLVAIAANYNEANVDKSDFQRFKPYIYFNAGRIISYTLLGGVIGAIGSVLTLSSTTNGVVTIVASGVMIVLGLQMLRLFPALGRFMPSMPKSLAHKIHDFAARETNDGAFVLGALTFFLPCGFTQALQLYVLAKGGFATGALTMLAFSLGTLPALLSLSAMTSLTKGTFHKHFLKFAGAAVIVMGFVNIQYGLVLAGVGSSSSQASPGVQQSTQTVTQAPARSMPSVLQPSQVAEQVQPQPRLSVQSSQVPGQVPVQSNQTKEAAAPVVKKQTITMKVVDFDYFPHRFTVTQGVPVDWWIDGSRAAGCGRVIIVPKLRIQRLLSANSTTLISFTPQEIGDIYFNCGMGMMTPGSKITVVGGPKG